MASIAKNVRRRTASGYLRPFAPAHSTSAPTLVPYLSTLPLSFLLLHVLPHGDVPQWSGFRGNNGAGVSGATRLPEALDPEESLMWRVEVPTGYSSPVVADKDLFLTGATHTTTGGTVSGRLATLCLDAFTGETRWKQELDFSGPRPGMNSPAAPTPATDGEVVVTLFHHLGLVTYDTEGKELWRQPLGPFNIPHGMSTSPLIHRELVVLQVDQDDGAYLVAYDRKSGEQHWRIERPGVTHAYATPAIHEAEGGPAQVVVSGTFQVAGYSLANGEKLWWMDGSAWQAKSMPVFARGRCYLNAFMPALSDLPYGSFSGSFADTLAQHDADEDGKIAKSEYGDARLHEIWFLFDQNRDGLLEESDWGFALASNHAVGGLFAVELGGKGDVTRTHVKWKSTDRRGLSDVTTPVIAGEALFMVGEGGLLTSLDLESGKILKQERVGQPDEYYASPVAGDGKLYLASQSGILTVVKAQPEFEVLASHALEDEEVWATPAIAGRSVYVRGKTALYCFERLE
jgi:outer membrane protein assembly factor BamB